jgi:hypothetical protein
MICKMTIPAAGEDYHGFAGVAPIPGIIYGYSRNIFRGITKGIRYFSGPERNRFICWKSHDLIPL